jgi:hypothetical protein
MRKFTTSINEDTKDTKSNGDNIEKMIKKTLNIKVNGDINHYLGENIEIEGVDKLSKRIQQLIVENSKLLMEKVRYQGLDNVEKEIRDNNGEDK